jgi:hypothetical protein
VTRWFAMPEEAGVAGWEVLRDAVPVQVPTPWLASVPPGTLDGLVLAGPSPIADLRRRRLAGDGVLLIDRERYRRAEATAGAPFSHSAGRQEWLDQLERLDSGPPDGADADPLDLDLAAQEHASTSPDGPPRSPG